MRVYKCFAQNISRIVHEIQHGNAAANFDELNVLKEGWFIFPAWPFQRLTKERTMEAKSPAKSELKENTVKNTFPPRALDPAVPE